MALRVITTVVTPADSYDLVTLAQAKAELSITSTDHDAKLGGFIAQESRGVANYCHRVFLAETVKDEFFVSGGGFGYREPIQLSRYPVIEITDVSQQSGSLSETLVVDDDFRLLPDVGQMLRVDVGGVPITWESWPLSVTYDAGFEEIPDDLQRIVLELITSRFRSQGRDPALIQRDQEGRSERFWCGPVPGQDSAYPPNIAAALSPYVVPVVV